MDLEKIKKNKIESQMRKAEAVSEKAEKAVCAAEAHPSAASNWGRANIARKKKAAGRADANLARAQRDILEFEGNFAPRTPTLRV